VFLSLRKFCEFRILKITRPDGEIGRPAYRQVGALASGGGMSWTVYAIQSQVRNYIYVGMTSDLQEWIGRHNGGRERTTRPYKPFRVIFTEQFESRAEARKKEKYLKSGSGKELLKRVALATEVESGSLNMM
jgi:putative endonuclease